MEAFPFKSGAPSNGGARGSRWATKDQKVRIGLTFHPYFRGFTLVELLVVIAIIGILIALLLPAVQAAREAARRLQCSNNFKQVGLALHNYHDANRCFPPGTTNHPSTNYEGFSWALRLLPYMEMRNIFDQINFSDDGYCGSSINAQVVDGVQVPTYTCPSSPCPVFYANAKYGGGTVQVHIGTMVGIAGAIPDVGGNRTDPDSYSPPDRHAWNGVLFGQSSVRIGDITDGTTNVVVVGETSDWGRHPSDPSRKYDCRGMFPHGWMIGADRARPETPASDPRVFTTTVIHTRPLGSKFCEGGAYGSASTSGTNYDNNVPIQSAHPGGAHLLFCDGSVHFLADTIDFTLFKLLAIRDSGQVKSWQR